jgi:hypothetical protein
MQARRPILGLRGRWALGIAVVFLFYIFVWRDPMFQLALALSRNPMWLTGFFGSSDAPLTANAEEILKPYLHNVSSNQGGYHPFLIRRVSRLYVFGSGFYSAALIDSPGGEAIVLFRHVSGEPDILHPKITEWWWTKLYSLPL